MIHNIWITLVFYLAVAVLIYKVGIITVVCIFIVILSIVAENIKDKAKD